mmetsp:Transcript_31160/g.36348  ORF Transcript_31160/g.36348 Transcript_31160/m.36348 type:complete len:578 (+) Transcript_31160:189-1922(+)
MELEYEPPTYQQNEIVAAFRGSPRFGHTNDFYKLFSKDSSDVVDYTLSTIFIGAFLMGALILWLLSILIFLFIGEEKVGVLSGFPAVEESSKSKQRNYQCRTSSNIRIIFLFSCLLVIVSSILSTFMFGFHDLKISSDDLLQTSNEFLDIINAGRAKIQSLERYGDYSTNLREILLADLSYESFCVNTSLDDRTGYPMNVTRQQVVDSLEALGDFNVESFQTMNDELLYELQNSIVSSRDLIAMLGVKNWYLLVYMISFTAVASIMLITVILTWVGAPWPSLIFFCTWFLLPIFMVMVMLSWTIVSFIGVAAVMNADFCTGGSMLQGPDMSVVSILTQAEVKGSTYDASTYWFAGCQSDDPFVELGVYSDLLNNSLASIELFENMMENVTIAELETICGVVGDFDYIIEYFGRLDETFRMISKTTEEAADTFSCESINPLYIDAVHDNICTAIPESTVWAFSSLLIVSFFGMMMITFRSAWLETVEKSPKNVDQVPIMSIERINDIDSEQFRDSPRPLYDLEDEKENVDGVPLVNVETGDDDTYDKSGQKYRKTSVADETLRELPASPSDPPGYRVY